MEFHVLDADSELVTEDGSLSYPIRSGILILRSDFAHSRLESSSESDGSRTDDKSWYASAVADEKHYSSKAVESNIEITTTIDVSVLEPARHATHEQRQSFPKPGQVWVDSSFDYLAQIDAMAALAPMMNGKIASGWRQRENGNQIPSCGCEIGVVGYTVPGGSSFWLRFGRVF